MTDTTAGGPLPALALPVLDPALAERLVARMAQVEERLEREITSEADFITVACRHLLHAGGKRIRPLLVLMAAETGGSAAVPADAGDDPVLTAACVVELTHLASLYHDDVMDEALLRRGAQSSNARWDNHVSILAGDWLFSKSSELTADLGADAVRIQAQTFSRLVEGQILETLPAETAEGALEHHLRVIGGKTGSLIATSARYGAMFGGASDEVTAALTEYGEMVGVAFQLSDDILDIASDSVESGKTPGTDLREGVPTLPMLYALATDGPEDARLRELLGRPLTDDGEHAEALALLRAHPAMDQARSYVLDLARRASGRLDVLPAGPVRDALVAFADLIATRTT
ncbi:polyprenyl synthetase family protein [Nocardioides sp. HDW12B]|uniref:polyprenyl synthetase family protein n=1 Tax=Nocardioides sp. HDW12B TaxID=2714939 RepID=UPI00140D8F14|nr:polyprenyl synthetase family protein [Nocardioides sp. HDW12B]QIK65160.1 polyprenyl synthetase family protein [Nocardioides sp. HDW12B]